jgi:hypothetical protein
MITELQSATFDIRDAIYNCLTADSVFGAYTLRKDKMYPVPPALIPYLGVYIIDDIMVPDGDANAGMVRFNHTGRIGISMVLANPDRVVLEQTIDQSFWKIMRLLWCDQHLMNVLINNNPESVGIESIVRGTRRHVWGNTAANNETPFCELQYEISTFYRTEWYPDITTTLDEIDVTTGVKPGDTQADMDKRIQVAPVYTFTSSKDTTKADTTKPNERKNGHG